MSLTLAIVKDRVALHLDDAAHLVWSDAMLESAARTALADISSVSGETLTLSGLDGAAETSLPPEDDPVLVAGAVAYALSFRVAGRFEDARAHEGLPAALSVFAAQSMARFQSLLAGVKSRRHHTSPDVPYTEWPWEEPS